MVSGLARITLLGLLSLIVIPWADAQSQATTGIIEGRVVDEDGSILKGAQVEFTNLDTNYRKVVFTNDRGIFRGVLLPLGPYQVRGQMEGYYITLQEGFEVSVGKTLNVTLTLKKANEQKVIDLLDQLDELTNEAARQEVMEEITVVSDRYEKIVETSRIESSTQIDEIAVQGLPNDGRNFLDYMTLTPGVTIVQGPDGAEISISGQKGINNNISVDGADFNNPFFGEQRGGQRPAFTFNLDAVQEVVVVGDGAPAEFGRSSAGFVNVITKSGTNQVNGTAHLFYKDDSLNSEAKNPDGTTQEKYPFEQQQAGFTLGGPLIKDRLFYFASVDAQNGSSTKQNDPTRIDPRVVDYFASIGVPGENGPIERTNDALAFLFKMDWNINQNHFFTGRLTATQSEQVNGTFDVDSWGRSANAVEKADSRAFSAQLNSVLTGEMVNEFRFQWAREERPRPYNGPDNDITGRPLPDTAFDFANAYRFGMPFFIPVSYHDTRLQINDNLSIVKGTHLFKMGFELNYTTAKQTFIGFANGRWIFSSTEGFLNYVQNPNYVECSDGSVSWDGSCPEGATIVGPVLLYLQQAGVGDLSVEEAGTQNIKTTEVAVFLQDKWDVRPNLVLQYGLRWEAQYQPDPITPADEVFFADFIGTTRQGQEFPSDGNIPSDDAMWQPRLGMTWDPKGDGASVLRANAGIYYARIPGLALASTRSTNGSRGQSLYRDSSLRDVLGPTPEYPYLIPQEEVGDPFRPDVYVFDEDFRNPRSIIYSATYEQRLTDDMSGYLKFTYIDGDYQTRFINRNDPALGSPWSTGLGEGGVNGVGALTVVESIGESLYRGWTLGFNKRMADRFAFQANYTYSKDFSHDDNERDPFTYRYASVTDLDADWGYSDRDQRHRAAAWVLWNAPLGIDVNASFTYRSAQPKSLTYTGEDAATPQDRINPDGTITPRNTGRKDNAYRSLDLRISRAFEMRNFQLEAIFEVFNALNQDNFLQPQVTNLIFNFDGTVQSGAGIPRQIQLGVKGRF